ncbi:hypothetical protein ACF0H5_006407 [Mactra antiquata]
MKQKINYELMDLHECRSTSVLLNLLVIFLVVKDGKFKAPTDIFLTNLAISDILHASVITPIHLQMAASDDEDFSSNVVCKIVMFLPLLSVMSAIFTVVAIAIDRYRSIVNRRHIYRRGALTVVGIIWIASALFSAPQIYEYNTYFNTEGNYTACGSEDIVEHFETVYASFAFCGGYLIPLLIIAFCYTKVFLCVWRHGKRFKNTTAQEITGLDDSTKFEEWPQVASRLMTVLSTLSNPLLYLIFNDTFCASVRSKCSKALGGGHVGNSRVAPFNTQTANSSAY